MAKFDGPPPGPRSPEQQTAAYVKELFSRQCENIVERQAYQRVQAGKPYEVGQVIPLITEEAGRFFIKITAIADDGTIQIDSIPFDRPQGSLLARTTMATTQLDKYCRGRRADLTILLREIQNVALGQMTAVVPHGMKYGTSEAIAYIDQPQNLFDAGVRGFYDEEPPNFQALMTALQKIQSRNAGRLTNRTGIVLATAEHPNDIRRQILGEEPIGMQPGHSSTDPAIAGKYIYRINAVTEAMLALLDIWFEEQTKQ